METSNDKKIVQNAILIDTSEPADYKETKQMVFNQNSIVENFIPPVNQTNNVNSQEFIKKTETELQNKNDKKKNFFNKFTEKLKSPQSEVLKTKLLQFIKETQNDKYKSNEIKQKVSDFINDFEIEFQNIWKENGENEYENGEAVEGIITKALYSKLVILYPSEKDRKLEKLFKIYDFIQLTHLECKQEVIITTSFDHAIKHIHKIDDYKTPRDKLISIINCCKLVSSMVWQANKETSKPTGADDFLPVLIYVVLKAQPKNPIFNIEFIRDFRQPHRLRGEEDYYFTAYDSAVNFLEKLDASHLKIDPKEFQRLTEANTKRYTEEMEENKNGAIDPNESTFKPFKDVNNLQENNTNNQKILETEMTDFQNFHLTSIKNRVNEVKDLFSIMESKKLKYPTKELSQLTVTEVSDLLNEYKYVMNIVGEMKKKVNELGTFCEDLENDNGVKTKKSRRLFGIF